MLKTLTLGSVWPYVLGALIASHAGVAWWSYGKGKAREAQIHQAAGVRDFIRAVDRAADVARAVADIGAQLREQLADSRTNEDTTRRTVRTVVNEHPDFAAVRRPAELQRVRRADLERIARAAATD